MADVMPRCGTWNVHCGSCYGYLAMMIDVVLGVADGMATEADVMTTYTNWLMLCQVWQIK